MNISSDDRACTNCNHCDVCKYKDDFMKTYKDIQTIGSEKNLFITVFVRCKHWIGKIQNMR